jgi:uncharacterized protein YqjF (DUF2071 family)
MLNYEVDPAVLLPRVPRGTELDDWQGKVFASVVGFLFLNTRVLGVAVPWHRNFEELNLRFYVRRLAPDGWRRGVVFVREIVPLLAVAGTARLLYGEQYAAMPMRHHIEHRRGDPLAPLQVEYAWRHRGRWDRLSLQTCGEAAATVAGSQEEFITEHYWGYAAQRDGGCVEYQVAHPRWRVWRAAQAALDCDVTALYGQDFAPYLAGRPSSAFLADGSAITVYRGARLA